VSVEFRKFPYLEDREKNLLPFTHWTIRAYRHKFILNFKMFIYNSLRPSVTKHSRYWHMTRTIRVSESFRELVGIYKASRCFRLMYSKWGGEGGQVQRARSQVSSISNLLWVLCYILNSFSHWIQSSFQADLHVCRLSINTRGSFPGHRRPYYLCLNCLEFIHN
jgi:hypothetical protein